MRRPATTLRTVAILTAAVIQACTPAAAPSGTPQATAAVTATATAAPTMTPVATSAPSRSPLATLPPPLPSLPAETAGCARGKLATGDRDMTVNVDGEDRTALVHVPASAEAGEPLPLLLSFHGTFSDPADQAWVSGFSPIADAHGFVVAYPAGLGFPSGWWVDDPEKPDDVGFVVTLIEALDAQLCLDPRQTFLTGFSAGGIISHAVACRLDGRIGGIALVSTGHFVDQPGCLPAHPVPLIMFHGLLDPLIPYRGGWIPLPGFEDAPPVSAIRDWMDFWAANNGCQGGPTESEPVGLAVRFTWQSCAAPTVLVRLGDGGHAWPGGNGFEAFGRINHDVSASEDSWSFFTN